MQAKGLEVLDQEHKCLNKQLSGFFFLLLSKPQCDYYRDYNHLALRPPSPNILIMDEIHLYVAIIVPNCFFEGE